MKIVADTNVLVAALRSPMGASAEILRRVLRGQLELLVNVGLFVEYEAVMTRPEHLQVAGVSPREVTVVLDALAGVVRPVQVQFFWRPQLKDPADEMVLETAVNGGAQVLLTFNRQDFLPAAHRFGLRVWTPGEFMRRGAGVPFS